MNPLQAWNEYRPTKGALAWTAAGASILTMVVGFTWGGWVTGGTAQTMAAEATQDAKEQLVASICVERFSASPNAAGNLVELKDASSYQQDNFIEEGGWSQLSVLKEQVTGAADLCADRLVAMESLPAHPDTPDAATDASTADG